MSHSISYSPVLDIVNPQNLENVVDDPDPITNPFYYAQDRESWDIEVAAKAYADRQQKPAERKLRKKNKKSFKKASFIVRKEQGHARHLIKIQICDLDGRDMEENIETDNASVNVQFIVTSDYDDIMNETDHLVSKIVQKLSRSNV